MDGVPHDTNDVTIYRSIIELGLMTKGVENLAQFEILRVHGGETYPGWLFAKAMPADELEYLLKTQIQASSVVPIDG